MNLNKLFLTLKNKSATKGSVEQKAVCSRYISADYFKYKKKWSFKVDKSFFCGIAANNPSGIKTHKIQDLPAEKNYRNPIETITEILTVYNKIPL